MTGRDTDHHGQIGRSAWSCLELPSSDQDNSNDFLTVTVMSVSQVAPTRPGLLNVLDKLVQNSNCSRLVDVLPPQSLLCHGMPVLIIIISGNDHHHQSPVTSVTKDESLQHLH